MGISSTAPTSRRGYLSQDELEQFSNITITNSNEADDRISQAEEMIDTYVGFQDKFMVGEVIGRASAGASETLTLQLNQQEVYDVDYFKLCEVEIIGGVGEGQRRKITGSTKAGVVTVDTAWTTNPTTTSFYRIYQLGKFPRSCDVVSYSEQAPTTYYKAIPEAVKRAVAAQLEFLVEMGDSFFAGDKSDMKEEEIGDYRYVRATSGASLLVAPKVKMLLKGIRNRVGQILA